MDSRTAYIELMANLNLPNPKMMDVAVPENIRMGINIDRQREVATVTSESIIKDNAEGMLLVDLREEAERVKSGVIPGSVHAPYSRLDQHLSMLKQAGDRRVVFYCAVGERSTMAVDIACASGIEACAHIPGGFVAWAEAGGNVARV
jgi:rhodanese-related sulfurtransferase